MTIFKFRKVLENLKIKFKDFVRIKKNLDVSGMIGHTAQKLENVRHIILKQTLEITKLAHILKI